jgi:hypothetical protein
MKREPAEKKAFAAKRQGPVEPGSLLHRMLRLIAREVAQALQNQPSSSGKTSPKY